MLTLHVLQVRRRLADWSWTVRVQAVSEMLLAVCLTLTLHLRRRRTEAVVSAAEEARSSAQAALSEADLKERRKAAGAIYGER